MSHSGGHNKVRTLEFLTGVAVEVEAASQPPPPHHVGKEVSTICRAMGDPNLVSYCIVTPQLLSTAAKKPRVGRDSQDSHLA